MTRLIMTSIIAMICGSLYAGCGSSSGGGGGGPTGPSFQITTNSLPTTSVGSVYSQTLMTANGRGPYNWSVVAGALPSGLNLNGSNGSITGMATAQGQSAFTVRVVGSDNVQAERQLTINVQINTTPTWAALVMPDGVVGVPYSFDLKTLVSGGVTPYTFSVAGGALPNNLSLSTDGVVSGAPTTAATSAVSFRVESSVGGGAATTPTTITIN